MSPRDDTTRKFPKTTCFTCSTACRDVRCSLKFNYTTINKKSSQCDDANRHDEAVRLNKHIKKYHAFKVSRVTMPTGMIKYSDWTII